MGLCVLFSGLALMLPELEGSSYDSHDELTRAFMGGAVPAMATLVWAMAGPARTDPATRLLGLAALGLSTLTLVDAGWGWFSLAFGPLAALFLSPNAVGSERLNRTLDTFALLAAANLLWPWLGDLDASGNVGSSTRMLTSVGTISAVGVTWLSGRADGWRQGVPAAIAMVSSLLAWLDLDWTASGLELAGAAVLFALPTVAVLFAQEDDRLAWRDSMDGANGTT